jgi:hypothetical protein
VRKHKFIYSFLTLIIVGIISFTYLSSRLPGKWNCHSWQLDEYHKGTEYIHPDKVVVQPWKGEHHVYGIFNVPGGHTNTKYFRVSVPGNGSFCGELADTKLKEMNGVRAKPGHYLMKGYIKTRASLWLISKGKREDLKQPNNWSVGYNKQNS